MFGDGITHGAPVSSQYLLTTPAFHPHDFQRRAETKALVEELRELADGHAVAHRDRILADERLEAGFEHRALDLDAADRVRPVAHDHRHAMASRGVQAVRHRVDERVDARADVLEVDDERVEALEHLGGRLARLAVERVDGDLPPAVRGVRRLDHVVLQVRMEPVLRPEDGAKRHAVRASHPFDDVAETVIDGGGIGHHADAPAVEPPRCQEHFRAQPHAGIMIEV